MKVKELISKCMEELTIDIYSTTASQFIWGEIDAPESLKARMNNDLASQSSYGTNDNDNN